MWEEIDKHLFFMTEFANFSYVYKYAGPFLKP